MKWQTWLNNTLVKHIPFLVYTSSSVMLGKWKQPENSTFHLSSMIGKGCAANCESYTSLLSAYGRNGLFETSYSLLDKMKNTLVCEPDIFTCSIFIRSFIHVFEFEKNTISCYTFFFMVCFSIQALLWFCYAITWYLCAVIQALLWLCSVIQPDIFMLLYKFFNSNEKILPTLWNKSQHLLNPYQIMWFSIVYSVMVDFYSIFCYTSFVVNDNEWFRVLFRTKKDQPNSK